MKLEELLKVDNLIIMGSHEYPISKEIAFWGGMGVVAREVSKRLVRKGFNVLVVPRRSDEYASQGIFFEAKEGVHILGIPLRPFKAGIENVDLYNYYPVRDGIVALDHCYSVIRYLEKKGLKQAIFHGHDWMSVGLLREARKKKCPTIFSVHFSAKRDTGIPSLRLGDKRLELERLAGNYSQIIHYVSFHTMKSCQIYKWNSCKKHVIIPNGVDIKKYTPSNEDKNYVLFIGRLAPVKNVPQLILAWSEFNREYPDVGLKILGAYGVSIADVKRIISNLESKQRSLVELKLGMISEEEKIRMIQESSICAFPSSEESFGIVAIEAESCGKAVVVGKTGGFKENVLEGVTGVHVKGSSPKSIAKGLKDAYVNRKAWGRNARKLVETFYNWDKIVEDYVDLLYKGFP